MSNRNNDTNKNKRGFAAMPHEQVEKIARQGGEASAEKAGHKGMSERGQKGGEARAEQLGSEGYSALGREGGKARGRSQEEDE